MLLSTGDVELSGHEVFRDALRHRTWSRDPWGILGRGEARLRAVVDARLTRVS